MESKNASLSMLANKLALAFALFFASPASFAATYFALPSILSFGVIIGFIAAIAILSFTSQLPKANLTFLPICYSVSSLGLLSAFLPLDAVENYIPLFLFYIYSFILVLDKQTPQPKFLFFGMLSAMLASGTVIWLTELWYYTLAVTAIWLIYCYLLIRKKGKHQSFYYLSLMVAVSFVIWFVAREYSAIDDAWPYGLAVVSSILLLSKEFLCNQNSLYEQSKDDGVSLKIKEFAHDSTTLLPNQQHAINVLEDNAKTNQNLLVIVFKPINFYQINEVIGHENADLLLLQLAYCLQNKAKEIEHLVNLSLYSQESYVARLQSMNFMVVVDLSKARFGEENLISVVHRSLVSAIPEAFSFRNYSLNFELAFGACPLNIVDNNSNLAITAAGDALIDAEKNGNHFIYFDKEKQLFSQKRMRLLEQLSHCVDNGELDLFFQPQLDLKTYEVVGIEALVRWQHPDEGIIEAQQFISLAEQCGVIFSITRWVIKRVCRAAAKLKKSGLNFPISVNLSGKDLLEAELIDFLHQQIDSCGLSTGDIILEIDERDIVNSPSNKNDVIKRLVMEKFTIVLDNFLGGYDTLEPIRNMSIHSVKLDCHSLKLDKSNDAEVAILGALISLASSLDINVIGKNIESSRSSKRFSNIGGRTGQGLFLTKPLPYDNLLDWLTRRDLVNNEKPVLE